MLGDLLGEAIVGFLSAVYRTAFPAKRGSEERSSGSAGLLIGRNRYDVALRVLAGTSLPGLSRRWRRVVLEVQPGRRTMSYRRRWRLRRYSLPITTFERGEGRPPTHRVIARTRQIFPIDGLDARLEIAIWVGDIRALQAAMRGREVHRR